MNNLPDESELEGSLSKVEYEMQPTDEDLPTPEFDDMDSDPEDED